MLWSLNCYFVTSVSLYSRQMFVIPALGLSVLAPSMFASGCFSSIINIIDTNKRLG